MRRSELDRLGGTVRRARERRERARHEGERSLAQNLMWMGTLGWLVTLPMLAGLFFGRWLDARFGTGVTFASTSCVLGLAVGCWLAWRKVQQR